MVVCERIQMQEVQAGDRSDPKESDFYCAGVSKKQAGNFRESSFCGYSVEICRKHSQEYSKGIKCNIHNELKKKPQVTLGLKEVVPTSKQYPEIDVRWREHHDLVLLCFFRPGPLSKIKGEINFQVYQDILQDEVRTPTAQTFTPDVWNEPKTLVFSRQGQHFNFVANKCRKSVNSKEWHPTVDAACTILCYNVALCIAIFDLFFLIYTCLLTYTLDVMTLSC